MNRRNVIIIAVVVLILAIGVYAFISANSYDTKLEVTSNSTLKNGEFITLILKDDYRNVYPNQTVEVKILDDSGWAHHYNATTDETGTASVLLQGMDNGNYTVHSSFNGTMFLHKAKSVTNLEINDGLN